MKHVLKTWPEHFEEIHAGRKRFEVRRDDRGFAVGDFLDLCEYDPATDAHSGRRALVEVVHLLRGGQFGVAAGYVVMSIREVECDPAA